MIGCTPIYEYRCEDWGRITEFLKGVGKSERERKLERCGSERLSKIPSGALLCSVVIFLARKVAEPVVAERRGAKNHHV